MKFVCLIAAIVLLSGCTKQIALGTYMFKNGEKIIIKPSNDYYYTNGVTRFASFHSYGKVTLLGDIAKFIPDSLGYFRIKVAKYQYDSSLIGMRKIILSNSSNLLKEFTFTCSNHQIKLLAFDQNYTIVYPRESPGPYSMYIQIWAKWKNSGGLFPGPLHDSLRSNRILFNDIKLDDYDGEDWNVLVLDVSIDQDMFSFIEMPNYIYHKKKFIRSDWPVFKLKRY